MSETVVKLISEFIHQIMFKHHSGEFSSIPFTDNTLTIQYTNGKKIKVTFEEVE